MIYNPQEEFQSKFQALHLDNTNRFFAALTQRSGVNVEENRQTVQQYLAMRQAEETYRKKCNRLRFWRVVMCITLVLIPVVIWKTTPKIRQLREQIQKADETADALMEEAYRQMQPLNSLFTDRDALKLIEETIPMVCFEPCFSVKQEEDMRINYDFCEFEGNEESTREVLAGHYNENPFLFENRLIHTMGMETYHGYKTIHWTETYYSDGKLKTRTRTQTLHATVTKPKPFYNTQVMLNYCAQGGPDLAFTRDATNLDEKNERQIERYVRRGERQLRRKADKAVRKGEEFVSMSNSEFEVLFDALDRTNEVQFRTLFTPLAQTNMVDLILSKDGFGDDFHFIKRKRTNKIVSEHSQGREINLLPGEYTSYSYDTIQENFIGKNQAYFKAVYFDFAPVWAIPMYQERPVSSLKPIPDYTQQYSLKECETLANAVPERHMVHPQTKTPAILKASFVKNHGKADETCISAYSYDIEPRVDYVAMLGGDGHIHSVAVPWDEYIPLEQDTHFFVAAEDETKNGKIMAKRNGLCIYQ